MINTNKVNNSAINLNPDQKESPKSALQPAIDSIREAHAEAASTPIKPERVAPLLPADEAAALKQAVTLIQFGKALRNHQSMGEKPVLTGSLLNQAEQTRAWIKAGAKHVQYLPLENKNLHELPPEIGEFTGAHVINLAGNRLKALPSEIANCKTLSGLSLANNELTELPENFNELQNLTDLIIDKNQFSGEMPDVITDLKNLEILTISDNNITSFPVGMGRLKSLISLSYHNNPGLRLSETRENQLHDQSHAHGMKESAELEARAQQIEAEEHAQAQAADAKTMSYTQLGYYSGPFGGEPNAIVIADNDDDAPVVAAPESPYNNG